MSTPRTSPLHNTTEMVATAIITAIGVVQIVIVSAAATTSSAQLEHSTTDNRFSGGRSEMLRWLVATAKVANILVPGARRIRSSNTTNKHNQIFSKRLRKEREKENRSYFCRYTEFGPPADNRPRSLPPILNALTPPLLLSPPRPPRPPRFPRMLIISRDILLYPVGPVGWAPHVSRARKSSTCSDGGRDVFGGRDRKRSLRLGWVRANPRPRVTTN